MRTLFYNGNIISKGRVFPGMVLTNNGIIENIYQAPFALPLADKMVDLQEAYLAPGFVDTHIHGFGGFGTDTGGGYEDLLKMSKLLLATGVIAFCPTIYPAKLEDMVNTLKNLSQAAGKEEGAKIIGFHLEGPFISPKKPGALLPQDIQPVNIEAMQKIYEAAQGKIAAMTVAPELDNMEFLVEFAKEHDIVLQAGHTDATYEQAQAGAVHGITHVTHLFNAMRDFTWTLEQLKWVSYVSLLQTPQGLYLVARGKADDGFKEKVSSANLPILCSEKDTVIEWIEAGVN